MVCRALLAFYAEEKAMEAVDRKLRDAAREAHPITDYSSELVWVEKSRDWAIAAVKECV